MTYLRWPARTRMRHVPKLSMVLTVERERQRRVAGYLKYAYPPVIKNLHRPDYSGGGPIRGNKRFIV